jgi:hypothetical protein
LLAAWGFAVGLTGFGFGAASAGAASDSLSSLDSSDLAAGWLGLFAALSLEGELLADSALSADFCALEFG